MILEALSKAFEQNIQKLGVPATLRYRDTGAEVDIKAGMRSLSWKDTELINQYGANATVFTLSAFNLPEPPTQYDSLIINGEEYPFESVSPVRNGMFIIGYKIISGGGK